jgi:hypothetical protein
MISVYRLNNGHQRLSVFALLGERTPWYISVPEVYRDRPIASPILHYPLALYQDRPMPSPILRRHSDLAGHIPRPGGRATVMDRRSARWGLLRRGTHCYTARVCVFYDMSRCSGCACEHKKFTDGSDNTPTIEAPKLRKQPNRA